MPLAAPPTIFVLFVLYSSLDEAQMQSRAFHSLHRGLHFGVHRVSSYHLPLPTFSEEPQRTERTSAVCQTVFLYKVIYICIF